MILTEKAARDYNECASCGKSKREDGEQIYQVAIGEDRSHTGSVRICKPCAEEIVKTIKEAEAN